MSLSHALGWAAPLQIQVDGVNTTRTAFCVGENVTLTCTVLSMSIHRWSIPGYTGINGALVVAPFAPASLGPFLLELVDAPPDMNILSLLSFTIFPGLEGLPITCSDNDRVEEQTYTGAVLGEASRGYLSI